MWRGNFAYLSRSFKSVHFKVQPRTSIGYLAWVPTSLSFQWIIHISSFQCDPLTVTFFISGCWKERQLMHVPDVITKGSINCIAVWRMAWNCVRVYECIVNQRMRCRKITRKCFCAFSQLGWLEYCATFQQGGKRPLFFFHVLFFFSLLTMRSGSSYDKMAYRTLPSSPWI